MLRGTGKVYLSKLDLKSNKAAGTCASGLEAVEMEGDEPGAGNRTPVSDFFSFWNLLLPDPLGFLLEGRSALPPTFVGLPLALNLCSHLVPTLTTLLLLRCGDPGVQIT